MGSNGQSAALPVLAGYVYVASRRLESRPWVAHGKSAFPAEKADGCFSNAALKMAACGTTFSTFLTPIICFENEVGVG